MKKVIKVICFLLVAVVLSVTVTAVISRNTDGFNSGISFTNEKNLVHTLDEYVSKPSNLANGLSFKVNSTGSIVIDGTYDENAVFDYVFNIGTVTVDETDYYTLSGAEDGSLTTYYIKAMYEDSAGNTKTIISDFSDTMTSIEEIPEGTQVTIVIVIKPGTEFKRVTITPTFVAGEEPGRF